MGRGLVDGEAEVVRRLMGVWEPNSVLYVSVT